MKTKYSAKTAEIKNEKGWNSLDVYIFRNNSLLGKYRRNYPIFYNTFVPFVKDGKEFAYKDNGIAWLQRYRRGRGN